MWFSCEQIKKFYVKNFDFRLWVFTFDFSFETNLIFEFRQLSIRPTDKNGQKVYPAGYQCFKLVSQSFIWFFFWRIFYSFYESKQSRIRQSILFILFYVNQIFFSYTNVLKGLIPGQKKYLNWLISAIQPKKIVVLR